MTRIFLATALATALLIPAAQAAPAKFFDNLSGSWSGSGQAYVTKYGDISANCRVAITGAESKVAMNGSCGMLVFRQALGLSIRNAGGNKYVGTYTGSKTGPAKLDGTLQGNRLVMTIKWGGLVNGDRTADVASSKAVNSVGVSGRPRISLRVRARFGMAIRGDVGSSFICTAQFKAIATAVVFLASSDSSWVTGENFYIAGGMR